MRLLLRVMLGLLVAAIVGVAIVPVFVLRDLNAGGTGWGLCEGGVDGCTNSYFAGFELVAVLLVILGILAGLYRVVLRATRWAEHYYDRGGSLVGAGPPNGVAVASEGVGPQLSDVAEPHLLPGRSEAGPGR